MNRTLAYTSATLSLLALFFTSASSINAAPKSAAQTKMDACDRKLAADWTFCEGSKDSATRRKCDENAEARWKRCYENAGWVFSTQGQPKMPTRRPQSVNATGAGASSAGVDKGRPTLRPNANATGVTTSRSSIQGKPTPTPRPSPKKGVWLHQGPRQTGSHIR